jgi:hypothetical protein
MYEPVDIVKTKCMSVWMRYRVSLLCLLSLAPITVRENSHTPSQFIRFEIVYSIKRTAKSRCGIYCS